MTTQGHSLTFVQGHSDSTFSNFFSSKKKTKKTLGRLKPNFILPPWDVGMKICSNVTGHMTKIASRPIYDKNLQKSSLEPRGGWSWNRVLKYYQICSNYDHGLTMTIFMTWSKLFPNTSAWVKAYIQHIRGLSPMAKFVDQAGKIIIRQNKMMCVYGSVGTLCVISSALMQMLKFYANLIAQHHTRTAHFSD